MKEDMAERKRLKKEARAKGEVDARMVDDDDFDVNFTVVDFSKIDHGMGNKKFTSKFSFMQRDGKGKLDKRWDAGDVNDGGGDFWKNDGPSATEQAAAEKAEKKAAKKEARKKLKEEALAHEDEDTASPKAEKLKKKKKVGLHTFDRSSCWSLSLCGTVSLTASNLSQAAFRTLIAFRVFACRAG